jgi:ADP-ribose pyrophosphatase
MSEFEELRWEKVSEKHIVQDEWIDFRRVCYRFPDGTEFEPYYNYSRRSFVIIVAIDENGKYICVRQYRHGIDQVTTEFSAGGIERSGDTEYGSEGDSAEEELEAAKRELQEETGYVSDHWKHLITIPANPTIADNYAHIYLARGCRKVSGQELDDTEYLNAILLSKEELNKLIEENKFQQPTHLLAYLLAEKANSENTPR